ncbi:hypothetical protein M0R45_007673 [Rubus argutus]|uniref:Uncharacterized protein n=1 Tax=Rubus argutus TaxID=59490 RepID=A0AAW1Y256_RUBAR
MESARASFGSPFFGLFRNSLWLELFRGSIDFGSARVTFPQWGDQVTNAKYLVDVFGVGLRLCRGKAENKLVMRDEVEKCLLEAMVGETAVELKQNALKWKKAAEEAVAECGSSNCNLQDFLDEIGRLSNA